MLLIRKWICGYILTCAVTLSNHYREYPIPSCSCWREWDERKRGWNCWAELLSNCTFFHIFKEEKLIILKRDVGVSGFCMENWAPGTCKTKPSTRHKLQELALSPKQSSNQLLTLYVTILLTSMLPIWERKIFLPSKPMK